MAVTLSSLFNEAYYLQQNPDVAAAVSAGVFASGQAHWDLYGRAEGRAFSPAFNATAYAANNPDLAAAGVTGTAALTAHFTAWGFTEGRNFMTSAQFNATDYAAANPDLAANGVTGASALFQHFIRFGITEGRVASAQFSAAAYLAANPDVAAVLANGGAFAGFTGDQAALYHYYNFGVTEGRAFPQIPAGQTFSLTTNTDNLVGTIGNDTFTAGEAAGTATFGVGDQIDGGAGNDTLNWVTQAAIAGVPTGAKVTSVETVNVISGAAITLNTSTAFADTTVLNTTTSGAAQTITASKTQDVTVNAGAQAAAAVSVTGGDDVTVNATGVTTGTTTVANAAGNVAVNVGVASADGTTAGAVTVTGGKTVTVTSTTTNAVNTEVTQSAVTVNGTADTTSVTVNQEAAATAGATVVGKVNGAVTITDVNSGSATAAGKIATVSLSSYGNSTINSGALTTLNLSGTGGTLGVTAGSLTTPVVDTLALNVNNLSGGAITLDADYKTLNISGTGKASTIANVTGTGVETLTVAGDAKVTLTADTFAALKSVTVTNTAGASLGTALANTTSFVGGAGADSIVIGATTKTINMGAGDDVVTLNSATLGAGGTLNGGEGRDTLVANTNGSSFIADPAFGGFEVLRVAGAAAQGSHNANGFTALEIGATAGATTFTNVAANVGLTVLAAPIGGTTVTLANATGTADVFNLTLTSSAALAANSVTLAGVETVNITNTDTNSTAHTNTLTLAATSATSVVVTGNAGLTLTNTGNVKITNFDASGITGTAANAAALAVTFTSANTTVAENVTIKGGSGNDVLTGGSVTNDAISGGAGADTLVYTGGADVFTGGAGNDTFDVNAVGTRTSFLTIADATAGDVIDLAGISTNGVIADGTINTKVTLGSGATLDQYLDAAAGVDGSAAAVANWFQFGGDTYIVVSNDDNTGGALGFTSGTDALIKLTGLVDLSSSAFAGELLTIA